MLERAFKMHRKCIINNLKKCILLRVMLRRNAVFFEEVGTNESTLSLGTMDDAAGDTPGTRAFSKFTCSARSMSAHACVHINTHKDVLEIYGNFFVYSFSTRSCKSQKQYVSLRVFA